MVLQLQNSKDRTLYLNVIKITRQQNSSHPVSDSRTNFKKILESYCRTLEFFCRVFLIRSSTVAYIEIFKIYLKYWGSIVGGVLLSLELQPTDFYPFLSFEFWTCQIDGVKECCVRYRLVVKSSATAIFVENYQ